VYAPSGDPLQPRLQDRFEHVREMPVAEAQREDVQRRIESRAELDLM
jgi:hypothetical protein